jgi:hypothetical protein
VRAFNEFVAKPWLACYFVSKKWFECEVFRMAIIDPVVRHMIVCEDVVIDPNDPRRVTFEGLQSTINAPDPSAFPLMVAKLSVYLKIAGGRGAGTVRLVVLEESTAELARHHRAAPQDRSPPILVDKVDEFIESEGNAITDPAELARLRPHVERARKAT